MYDPIFQKAKEIIGATNLQPERFSEKAKNLP
jgi:hypothetical protein